MSSSMPEREPAGQWAGSTQEQERAGAPAQRGAPGQEHVGQDEFGQMPQGRVPGQPEGGYPGQYEGYLGQQPYQGGPGTWQPGHAGGLSPVSREQTDVVGRRVTQYIIDYVLAGIIPFLADFLFNRGRGVLHGFGWTISVVISLVVYFWYWVLRPASHNGQSFGMQLLGLRIVSKDGGPASMVQLLIRGVLLLVDTLFFGLVGLVSMLVSHYHQRVGDHAARTLVVATDEGGYGGFGTGAGGGRQFGQPGDDRELEGVGAGRGGDRDTLAATHERLGSEHERLGTQEEARAAEITEPGVRPLSEGAPEH